MTYETEAAAKAEIFRSYREKAVSELNRYVPDGMEVEDTWEGVMKAVDYILDHADREGEKSGAVMTAAMWMHGYLEEDTACRLGKLRTVVDGEVETALAGRSAESAGHGTGSAGHAAKPAEAK